MMIRNVRFISLRITRCCQRRVRSIRGRWLTEHGIPSSAIPIIKDRYVAHHGNLGGAAYVFLQKMGDLPKAIEMLGAAPGG